MPSREWDGRSYDRISAPMEALGREVLDRLPLRGDEVVLDAGCGSGRVTAALAERLPRGRVIGVDGSAEMLEVARERLGPGVELLHQDLVALELPEPVDAVLSTATFHWIADHETLFARLFAALRPGGRLVAQCGGHGNVQNVHDAADRVMSRTPYAEPFAGWHGPWHFATPQATERRLLAAGFEEVACELVDRPVTPEDGRTYLATIVLGSHLERLPEELRDPFVDAVHAELGDPFTIAYVRLNLDAARPRA